MKKIFLGAALAALLAGCGQAAAHHDGGGDPPAGQASASAPAPSHSPSSGTSACDHGDVGPTGQPLCGHLAKVVSTTNRPPENSSLIATCRPTGVISDGAVDLTLKIQEPKALGAEPINVAEVQVFLLENGIQERDSYPAISPAVTLNPGRSIKLHLSSPLDFTPGASPVSCSLGGVNFYGG